MKHVQRWIKFIAILSISLTLILVSASVISARTVHKPPAQSSPQTLVGAGDIASCTSTGDEQTAALIATIPGTVFTAGDDAYTNGTAAEFATCYDPSWGQFKARTKPAAGNHEYNSAHAQPYHDYFGAGIGAPDASYYSYNLGAWHIIVIDSNISAAASSTQAQWLRADLVANSSACALAIWHHPYFSSGLYGNDIRWRDLWDILYQNGVDIVINGHEHHYERFAPQDPDGAPDPARGIREFIVGTGGVGLRPTEIIKPNSEVHSSATFGVLKLTLNGVSYDWQFIPVAGGTFTDSGSGSCLPVPATATPVPSATPTLAPTATGTPRPPLVDTIGTYENGVWNLRNSNSAGVADQTALFGGAASDLPVVGDWDGDGIDTLGVLRTSTGVWFLSDSNSAPIVNYNFVFGNPGDTPFAGRWDNTMNHDGPGVYRNSNGILYLARKLATGYSDYFFIYGNPGDLGVGGDWDADGYDNIGVYRASGQHWYLNNDLVSFVNYSDIDYGWDIGASRPIVGDWDGDGSSTPGYLTSAGLFTLHSANSTAGTDLSFAFGPPGAYPVAGKWLGLSAPAQPNFVIVPGPGTTAGASGSTGGAD